MEGELASDWFFLLSELNCLKLSKKCLKLSKKETMEYLEVYVVYL